MAKHHDLLDTPRWRGIAHLGTGSRGSVQLVEDKAASDDARRAAAHMFAAKVLYVGADIIPDAITQHSSLSHSHVVRFVDAFPATSARGTALCVVTELAAGGNLWSLLRCAPPPGSELQLARRSTWDVYPFLEAPARCVMQQATLALQYLHAKDVFGIALTPQDVLVSKWWMQRGDGGGGQRDFAPIVLLGGFQYTRGRLERGTAAAQVAVPSFLPPELHDRPPGAPPLPPAAALKADMWSLGVLLFFLLSGELPFTLCTELKGKHVNRVSARVATAKLVEPAIKALDRMPLGAKLVLQGLLCPDPAGRMDTVEVLRSPWIQEEMPASILALHVSHLRDAHVAAGGVPPPPPPPPPPHHATHSAAVGLLGGAAAFGATRSQTFPGPMSDIGGFAPQLLAPGFAGPARRGAATGAAPILAPEPRFLPAAFLPSPRPRPPPAPPPGAPPAARSSLESGRPRAPRPGNIAAGGAAERSASLRTTQRSDSSNTLPRPPPPQSKSSSADGAAPAAPPLAEPPLLPPGWPFEASRAAPTWQPSPADQTARVNALAGHSGHSALSRGAADGASGAA